MGTQQVELLDASGQALLFKIREKTQSFVRKVFKPDPATNQAPVDIEIAAYRHLQSQYLDGLLVPLFYGEYRLKPKDRSGLNACLQEASCPWDWETRDWDDWGRTQCQDFVKKGRAIDLQYLEKSRLEGLMTLHGAGLVHGNIRKENIIVCKQIAGGDHFGVMFIDWAFASFQKVDGVRWTLRLWHEMWELRGLIRDVQTEQASAAGRRQLQALVEDGNFALVGQQEPLRKACQMIQKEVLVRTVWVESKMEELPQLGLDTILEVLRLLALERDGRLLLDFVLSWMPIPRFDVVDVMELDKYYQAMAFALSCDGTHCGSAWKGQAYKLMITAFDIAVALSRIDGRLLSSSDTLRRKALGQARYRRVDEASETLKQGLVEQDGLPWCHEQVMRTFNDITRIIQNPSGGGSGVEELGRKLSAFGKSTSISHDLPRKNYPAGRDENTDHIWSTSSDTARLQDRRYDLGRLVRLDERQDLTPSHSQQVPAIEIDSRPLQPHAHTDCDSRIPAFPPSPVSVKQLNGVSGSKRDRDDNNGGDGSRCIKRAQNNDQETAASSESLRDRITRYRAQMEDHLSRCHREALHLLEILQKDPVLRQHATHQHQHTHTLPPAWLAGVDLLPELQEMPCHDLRLVRAMRDDWDQWGSLHLHVKLNDEDYELKIFRQEVDPGLTLEDRDLQERYLNSRFYSERFAHLQITWGKQTGKILLPLGRTCVGQTEIEGPLIDVLGNCKIQAPLNGQPPLRGLLLGFTDLERSSVRLDDLLSNEFPARPSSDKATAMLEEMVTRLHRCGVCRPNLSPANIRLINVGNRPSSQGSDHEEDFAHLGSNGSHMAGGFTDSISTSVVDSPESMELDHAQAADSEQHFEVVSLIGSTKWCREGERLDMQELQKLKEQIGVSRFFAITSLQ